MRKRGEGVQDAYGRYETARIILEPGALSAWRAPTRNRHQNRRLPGQLDPRLCVTLRYQDDCANYVCRNIVSLSTMAHRHCQYGPAFHRPPRSHRSPLIYYRCHLETLPLSSCGSHHQSLARAAGFCHYRGPSPIAREALAAFLNRHSGI